MSERVRPPAARGYRMPAEWETHAATWLTWPQSEETWPGRLDAVARVWVDIVRWVGTGEEVHILVNEKSTGERVAALLRKQQVPQANVFIHTVPSDDAWVRDHGPTFVSRNAGDGAETAVVDWEYNAWGGKYPPWDNDAAVARRIAELLGLERFEPGIVMEGGAIDVNGRGTVLTSEECLLNKNRNPALTRAEIEQVLREFLGVQRVLWLGAGIAGDDTDGHVDEFARFVGPNTVVAAVEDDRADANFESLMDNWERLQRMKDQDGQPLNTVALPMPAPVVHEGTRLPASYTNFYIANAVVLVPTFCQDADHQALKILESLFPRRQVVGIDSTELVRGLGAIHCVTQQQPWSGSTESQA